MKAQYSSGLILHLHEFSPILVTRKIGDRLRGKIEEQIRYTTEKLIILDFANVDIIDYSFADESIGKLLLRVISGEFDNKYLILTNIKRELRENIDVALHQRKIPVLVVNGEFLEVAGYLKEQLKETLELLVSKGKISARELADIQNTTINVSNNRLSDLIKLKLAYRKEQIISGGGKQYLYYSLFRGGEQYYE